MKKILAIILIIFFLVANWCVGYSLTHSIMFGFAWILIAAVLGSLGGLCGIFIMKAFER